MRFFEILTLIVLGINLFTTLFFRRRGPLAAGLVWTALILTALHWFLEGSRWQMYPAYLLVFLGILLYYLFEKRDRIKNISHVVRWVGATLLVILLMTSIALPVLLPIPEIGRPGGRYDVGTQNISLLDLDRNDPYAPDPSAPRRIMVQIWYPARQTGGDKIAPWMDSARIVAPRIAEWIGLPSFFLNHLRLAESGAFLQAAPETQGAPYPLLLFSHGYGGFRAQNTTQALELASHGFIIAAVEHTYGAVVTVFPDGTVAAHNPETLPDGLPEPESLEATRALGQQWAKDLQFVLETLVDPDDEPISLEITSVIDPSRVGAFGHSTGGGAAIDFCVIDSRCDAVLTMDPYMKPVSSETLHDGLAEPALHIFSELWPGDENTGRFLTFREASSGETTSISIEGTGHYDFSDLPLLTPLAHAIGLKGPLSGKRVIEIVNTLSVTFFEVTLYSMNKGKFDLSLEIYPEINTFP